MVLAGVLVSSGLCLILSRFINQPKPTLQRRSKKALSEKREYVNSYVKAQKVSLVAFLFLQIVFMYIFPYVQHLASPGNSQSGSRSWQVTSIISQILHALFTCFTSLILPPTTLFLCCFTFPSHDKQEWSATLPRTHYTTQFHSFYLSNFQHSS